jgi:hypothetical protein
MAHDLSGDVKVQAYLKPESARMRMILRVPLASGGKATPEDIAKQLASTVELYENGARSAAPTVTAIRLSAASDRSFVSFKDALAHVMEAASSISGDQSLLDAVIDFPIHSAASEFSIQPGWHRLGNAVVTVLWFIPQGSTIRAFEYMGDMGLVRLDPSWYEAALTFVRLGFFHILDGIDHLLFLGCLVIPFRKLKQLFLIVTSFTVAHSITLIASAFNLAPSAAWFPPLIETLIAMSIVYMAVENILGAKSVHQRWIITFAFGLVHGFGFSFVLHETLQFAGSHLITSLLAFNVGVELGQILVLAILVPALILLFRYVIAERKGTVILSAIIAVVGLGWMWERGDLLFRVLQGL